MTGEYESASSPAISRATRPETPGRRAARPLSSTSPRTCCCAASTTRVCWTASQSRATNYSTGIIITRCLSKASVKWLSNCCGISHSPDSQLAAVLLRIS